MFFLKILKRKKKLVSIILVLFLVVLVGSSTYYLYTQQSFDDRSEASGNLPSGAPGAAYQRKILRHIVGTTELTMREKLYLWSWGVGDSNRAFDVQDAIFVGRAAVGLRQYEKSGFSSPTEASLETIINRIDAKCGYLEGTYSRNVSRWHSTNDFAFCERGNAPRTKPRFPAQGRSVTWMCRGIEGGENVTCRASRAR